MNPFVQNIKLNILQVNDNYVLVSDKNPNGPMPKKLIIPNHYFIEQIQRTSVYHLPNIIDVIFKQLKPSGRDLFSYITIKLKKDYDFIDLIHRIVCNDIGISRGTLHSGIISLSQAGIICKRDAKSYWINPLYMFNGNRIDYFRELGDDYVNIIPIG